MHAALGIRGCSRRRTSGTACARDDAREPLESPSTPEVRRASRSGRPATVRRLRWRGRSAPWPPPGRPGGTWLVPGLAVLRGPLGVALAAAGSGPVRGARDAAGAGRGRRRIGGRPVACSSLGPPVVPRHGRALVLRRRLRVSGDEPHYLLMAQSLWREGDLDLQRQPRARGLARVHAGPDRPRTTARRGRTAGPIPPTAPACRCCWRPSTRLGGRLACVAAAGPGRRRPGAVRCARSPCGRPATPAAALVAWAALPGPPVFFYAFHVYTEVPSRRWPWHGALRAAARGARPWPAALAAAPARRALPWLHVKMIPAAAAAGPVALVRLRGRRAGRVRWPWRSLMAAGYLAYLQHVFGRPVAARDLRRPARRGCRGSPLARGGRACCSTAPSACCPRAGVPARPGRPGPVVPPLARRGGPCLVGVGRARCPCCAGGCGGAGSARRPASWSRWCPLLARRAGGAAWPESPRGLARWRWPLAGDRARAGALRRRAPRRAAAPEPRRPSDPAVGRALGRRLVERYLPSLVPAPRRPRWRVAAIWLAVLAALLALDRLALRQRPRRPPLPRPRVPAGDGGDRSRCWWTAGLAEASGGCGASHDAQTTGDDRRPG